MRGPTAVVARHAFVVASALTCAGLLAGCTRGQSGAPPSFSASATGSGPSEVASSPPPSSPPASAAPVLPAGCSQLLPLQAVQDALGSVALGKVTYLRAAPVPVSGRTGRVTCGYEPPARGGATASASASASSRPPLVQVSYITYVDATTAAGRVSLTVQQDGRTSTISKATVDGLPAWVLTGTEWDELVMAAGARTIVVEVSPTILPAEKAAAALTSMAATMLKFAAPTGAASGGPSAGAATSSS